MGKSYTSVVSTPMGAQASDLARNYVINVSGVSTNQKTGDGGRGGYGTGGAGGGAGGAGGAGGLGAMGTGAAGASSGEATGFNSFENMISGLDPAETELFKLILGQNYSLANKMAGVSTEAAAGYATAAQDLEKQYAVTSDVQKSVADIGQTVAGFGDTMNTLLKNNGKYILAGAGVLLAFLLLKGKK